MRKTVDLPKNIEKDLRKFLTRQGRKKADFYLIEGERCCAEALQWCENIRYGVVEEDRADRHFDFPVYTVPPRVFAELSHTDNSQGIFLVAERPEFSTVKLNDPFILVLDRLQEPGNLGTILRTALSVGLREIALVKGTVDPFNPKAVRSGMGAQFRQTFTLFESLREAASFFSDSGRQVWLTTPHSGVSCYDESFDLKNSALVLGEEGGGIEDFSIGEKTTIPMPGNVESLNVAQAATIFLFEGVRRGLL